MTHATDGIGVHAKLDQLVAALTTPNLRTAVNHIRRRMRPVYALDPTSTEWTAWMVLAREYRDRCAERARKRHSDELAARIAARMEADARPPDEAAAIAHAADEDEFYRRHPAAAAVADTWLDDAAAAAADPWCWHRHLLAAAGYRQGSDPRPGQTRTGPANEPGRL